MSNLVLEEDTTTVQITEANSLLGTQLLEGDWDEALEHLATPEGRQDVECKNDPLGLFDAGRSLAGTIPQDKSSAFFAALFVRAPYTVIAKIFELAPFQCEQDDLMYVLSVIPSEEENRLQTGRQRLVSCRSRAWQHSEYDQILRLLLGSSTGSPPDPNFLSVNPNWILPVSSFSLTPLAMAAYNPDVNFFTLHLICTLEPRAINTPCKLFGVKTTPLFIAAASPLPPNPSVPTLASASHDETRESRWRKVKLLTVGVESHSGKSNFYDTLASPPEPTVDQIHRVCIEAIQQNEWELVREFLKRQDGELPLVQAHLENTDLHNDSPVMAVVVTPTRVSYSSSSILEPIRRQLQEHDALSQSNLQKRNNSNEKARSRNEWAHRNMGPVMYTVDAALDLATSLIPSSWFKKRQNNDEHGCPGIVSPMS